MKLLPDGMYGRMYLVRGGEGKATKSPNRGVVNNTTANDLDGTILSSFVSCLEKEDKNKEV